MDTQELLTPTARALLSALDALTPARRTPETIEAALAALLASEAPGAAPRPEWLRRLALAELGDEPFKLEAALAALGCPTDNGTQRLAGNALRALGYEKRRRSVGVYWSRPAPER